MNQKDIIKYALIAVGAYLVYKYIQDHGGLEGLFGSVPVGGVQPFPVVLTGASTGSTAGTSTHTNAIQPVPPVLDMTGLAVVPDVNDSLTGIVKINGVPVRLSVITADGRIFDGTGTEVTARLQGQGIDVVAIRTAFQAAAPPVASAQPNETPELAGLGWGNPWTN